MLIIGLGAGIRHVIKFLLLENVVLGVEHPNVDVL